MCCAFDICCVLIYIAWFLLGSWGWCTAVRLDFTYTALITMTGNFCPFLWSFLTMSSSVDLLKANGPFLTNLKLKYCRLVLYEHEYIEWLMISPLTSQGDYVFTK